MLILAQPQYDEVYEKCDPRSVQREKKRIGFGLSWFIIKFVIKAEMEIKVYKDFT